MRRFRLKLPRWDLTILGGFSCRTSVSARMRLFVDQDSELAGGWGRMRRFRLQLPRWRLCHGSHGSSEW
jgi:hypothetical protein